MRYFCEFFSWDIYVRYFWKQLGPNPVSPQFSSCLQGEKRTKLSCILLNLHEIFLIFVKFCHEIFMWDIFVKKLGHNPGSIQLTSGLQHKKSKMLSCFFRNFHEIFTWDIFVKCCHEIFTWDIFVKFCHEIFKLDLLSKY